MKYISWGFSVIAFVAVLIFIPIICWQIDIYKFGC